MKAEPEDAKLIAALSRCADLLEAAGKAIEDKGWDMDFTHVDGIETDHIGFATDCENAVAIARAAIRAAEGSR